MADGSENIGNINVGIGADYSPLVAAFADATSKAEQAGTNISDALVKGAQAGGNIAEELAGQLGQIQPAADQAAAGLDEVSASAQTAGSSAQDAEGSFGAMAEKLAAIGEALVITEGLREFGAEALSAADNITHASIALTTMTGSSEAAETTIKQLEGLGMADGLAMPSLLTAAQRMTAILPVGTDVVEVMGHIADGAAAMGTDIESASNRFDIMANSGTLSGRSLTSLGLSVTSVVDALNQLNPATKATADNATSMFRALDPGDRITVLETALNHLGGTAEQVANQTFGGQWQQLANAWEAIMVQVGQALLPVISDLLEFIKVDIAPFIQAMVTGFNELPGPVKETAVAIALVTAALVPAAGLAAAAAIGLNGLAEAAALLGLNSAEAAVKQEAEAAASVAQGEAAAGAAPEVAGLGEAAASGAGSFGLMEAAGLSLSALVGVTLVSGLAAAYAGFTDLNAGIKSAQANFSAISQSSFNDWLKEATTGLKNASISVDDLEAAGQKMKLWLDEGIISAQQFATAMDAIDSAIKRVTSENLAESMQQFSGGLKLVVDQTSKAVDEQSLLNQVLTDSRAKFDQVAAGYQAGTATAEQYVSAQKGVENATNAISTAQDKAAKSAMDLAIEQAAVDQQEQVATETVKQYADEMMTLPDVQKQVLAGLQNIAETLGPTVSSFLGLDSQISDLQSKMPGFGVILTTLSTGPLVGLKSALDEASAKVAELAAQMANGENVGQQYEKALKNQLTAQVALDQELAVAQIGLQGATDAYSLARDAVAAAQAKVDDLTTAFNAGLTTYDKVQQAQKQLATAQKELNTVTADGSSLVDQLSQQYPQLDSAVNSATGAINTQTTSLRNNVSALNDVASAVKQVESDLADAMGKASASFDITVQAGYHLGGGLVSGAGEFGTQSTQYGLYGDASTVAAQAKIQEQALYDQGYTPQAIAKAMSAPLDQVLADLGLKAAQAGQTKGAAVLAPPSVQQTVPTIAELTGGSSGGSTSTGSSSTPIASGGTYTSAAIDGGSYPAVTAHQASGEVWAVAGTASGSGGGGVSSTISTTVSQTIQQTGGTSGPALQAATQAIGGAVEQLATNSGQLLPIAQSMQQTAQASQQLATAVAGLLVHIGATGSSSGLPAVTGSSGTAYSVGTPTQTVAGGNPLGTAVPPPSSTPIANVPGYNPFGPTSSGPSTNSFQVNVDMRGALVGNSAQLQAQISDAVISSLTNKLFTSGARLTR